MGIFIMILIYIVGFFLSVLLLKKYGKIFGMDYDQPKTYVNMDDYSSNASAYMAFSLGWPIFWIGSSIFVFFYLLKKLVQKILDL